MEPSSEQEPAKKQHQTTCAPVSKQCSGALAHCSCHVNDRFSEFNPTVSVRSGMLEQGVDRIVAQVVDPKVNHIFRPQVERVVREFLSPGSCSEEPPAPLPAVEPKPENSTVEQGTHWVQGLFCS